MFNSIMVKVASRGLLCSWQSQLCLQFSRLGLKGLNRVMVKTSVNFSIDVGLDLDQIKSDSYDFPEPELNLGYLCDPNNKESIKSNIINRKGVGDIQKVHELYDSLNTTQRNNDQYKTLYQLFLKEALKIPNQSHPDILDYGMSPNIVETIGNKRHFDFEPKEFHEISHKYGFLKNNINNFTGHRSYAFVGILAELESALVKYSMSTLIKKGFNVISVPDILPSHIVECCGLDTKSERSQVYSLDTAYYGEGKCLSGTAEMAIAQYLMNKDISKNLLPLRLAAVSRCYRAEVSRVSEEKGIFRVHQFTKVEMFGVSEPDKSGELLDEFCIFEAEHFASLGLHLQVLDMPLHELGAQAYRKYDIEAWLPGKKMWGEVSSCSNCSDYQSRRLAIRSSGKHVHTVNGTACAIPRLVIALFETHQQDDGSIHIPEALQPFMKNKTVIDKQSVANLLRPIRIKHSH